MKTSFIIGAVSMYLISESFSKKASELIQKNIFKGPEVTIEVIGNKFATDPNGDLHVEDTHGNSWDINHNLKHNVFNGADGSSL